MSIELFFAVMPENKFLFKRDFEIKTKTTGFKFLFNYSESKEFDNYHK
jgi:hypothetical protein